MMNAKILRLNKAGTPIDWISREQAATLVVKNQVVWALGEDAFEIRGGINRLGRQSVLVPAQHSGQRRQRQTQRLRARTGQRLTCSAAINFYACIAVASSPPNSGCHAIIFCRYRAMAPISWTNVVTACKRCNHRKANRTPEEAGMELLAIPFVPNRYEFFYLANKNILADQMAFLKSQFSRNGNWL